MTTQNFNNLSFNQKYNLSFDYFKNKFINMDSEVEFILQQSLTENDASFSYDDIINMKETADVEINGKYHILMSDKVDSLLEEYQSLLDDKDYSNLSQDQIEENIYNLENAYYQYPEIMEWWLVTDDYMINQLEKRGECILAGQYWGRTCSGQSIFCDGVIQQIAIDILHSSSIK